MGQHAEGVKHFFFVAQFALGAGFVILLFFLRSREPKSGFKVREADRWKPSEGRLPAPQISPPSQKSKPKTPKKKSPLLLEGIRIDGSPHEILGVAPDASAADIQRAYRDLIKRFHPDVVGRPGSREWADSQRIAEAINQAKSELLKNAKVKKPR